MTPPEDVAAAGASRATRKRLVICSDGTWQSSVTGLENIPSNVTRLARSVARSGKDKRGREWQQLVYYDAGIGTGVLSDLERDIQGGLGVGFVGNVIEAYNFIVLNYSPGDEVLCFGFSRGAYTARAVAGLVNDIGIISPKDLHDFPQLYAKYQAHDDSNGFRKTDAYREWVTGVPFRPQDPQSFVAGTMPQWEKRPHISAPERSRVVQVVGVFDTVGSLGIPDLPWTRGNLKFVEKFLDVPDPGFHNVALSRCKSVCTGPVPLSGSIVLTQYSCIKIFAMRFMHWPSTSTALLFLLPYGACQPKTPCGPMNTGRPYGRPRGAGNKPGPARLGLTWSTVRCMMSCTVPSRNCCRSGSRATTSTAEEAIVMPLRAGRGISSVSRPQTT